MLKIIVGKNTTASGGASPKAMEIKGAEELKWEAMSVEELGGLASTQSMFGGAQTFLLVGALNSERQEEFLDMAEALVESPHTFIFEEEKLLKAPTVVLEKAGAKIEVAKKAVAKERGFDPFGLTFALAIRDKKKLWLGLTASLAAGEKPEAIAGLLHWKVKQELERATGAKREALINLSRQIVFMYHDSHRGAGELSLLLERFALTL